MLSHVRLYMTLQTIYSPSGSSSIGFFGQEYWSGVPFPSPGDLPDPGTEPRSPALYSLQSQPPEYKKLRFNPRVGKIPGEGNGNPLQYSCLVNSMDRGAWRATVHGVTKSGTRLNDFHFPRAYISTGSLYT